MLYKVLVEWWRILGPWVLGLLAIAAGLIVFLAMEAIQALWYKRLWWLIVAALVVILIADVGISIAIAIGLRVTAISAVWGTLIVTLMLLGVALIAEVRIIRRWITGERRLRQAKVTTRNATLYQTSALRQGTHVPRDTDVVILSVSPDEQVFRVRWDSNEGYMRALNFEAPRS